MMVMVVLFLVMMVHRLLGRIFLLLRRGGLAAHRA